MIDIDHLWYILWYRPLDSSDACFGLLKMAGLALLELLHDISPEKDVERGTRLQMWRRSLPPLNAWHAQRPWHESRSSFGIIGGPFG